MTSEPASRIACHNATRYSYHDSELRRSRSGIDLGWASASEIAGGHPELALRKLRLLNQARVLGDLRVPPGNRLEALRADRQGQHSIRINDQWRICFVWDEGGPSHVEIVDYHA
jgi:plasmid maintenance system killer protein